LTALSLIITGFLGKGDVTDLIYMIFGKHLLWCHKRNY